MAETAAPLRLRSWWCETHSTSFELVRHFIARFFDAEMGTSPGEWQKVAIGVLATLLSVGILTIKAFMQRYTLDLLTVQTSLPRAQVYHYWVRGDMISLVAIAVAVTALLTLLLWQSLFPNARDCLALAGLPVRPRQIFQAKFAALLLLFTGFVAAFTLPAAVSFATATAGPFQENPSNAAHLAAAISAIAGACVFVFFSLLAIQGILLNVLPGRLFARVSLVVQAGIFIGVCGFLPLIARQPVSAAWWPPVWFLHLWEGIITGPASLARIPILAVTVPPAAAVLAYLLSYHRYRRLLLEAPPERSMRSKGIGSAILDRWVSDPGEQAIFSFIGKTLLRSRSHRLILLAYAGLALGWITKGALDSPRRTLQNEGVYGLFVALAPLALSMLTTVGLRYIFSLPVALRSNWLFRINETGGRTAWLPAVERFVIWCTIVPIYAVSLPAALAILGIPRALAVTLLALLGALIWFELIFRRWHKIPFTCSYLPGKQPVWLTLTRYALAIPLLPAAGKIILYGSADVTAFIALLSFLAVVWWKLRKSRVAHWSRCALLFEETEDAAVMALELKPAAELHRAPAPAAPAPSLFSEGLVASRGILPQAWSEEIADDRRSPSMLFDTLLDDIRFGLRLIRRNPLLSAVVVITLTIGIGINAAVFTVFSGFALRPHVWHDPDSFVRVILKPRWRDAMRPASYAEYIALRDHSRSLRHLAASTHFPAFIGRDDSYGSVGLAVSCNFFLVDGVDRPIAGRFFTAEDCVSPGPLPPVVIGEGLWRSRFGADRSIIGRRIQLNDRPVMVVGIAPRATAGWTRTAGWTKPPAVWVPFTAKSVFEPGTNLYGNDELWLEMAGRLAPGYSRSAAEGELTVLARRQDRLTTGRDTAVLAGDGALMTELQLRLSGRELAMLAFFGIVFNLVLVLSCANVATLLLSRAAARRREIAVRLSLGAPRVRLVRMLLTESLLLATLAGAASVYLTWRVPGPLFQLLSGKAADFPMPPDWRTFGYVACAVLLAGILAGLAPALESAKVNITRSLKGSAGSAAPRRLQGYLVAAQVALSMVMVVQAVLFAGAENRTLRAGPGYAADKIVVAPLFLPGDPTPQKAAVQLYEITRRLKAIPGVRSVAFSESIPLISRMTVEVRPPGRPDAVQPVDVYTASPDFFATFGIPIVRGREFELRDTAAVIVSEKLAGTFWRRHNPIGQSIALPGDATATVVGVAKDIDPLRFGGSENPGIYRPWRIRPERNVLSVRFDTTLGANGIPAAAAVRETIHRFDPDIMVYACLARTWIDAITEDLWNVVALIVIIGVIATLLATTGIYGAVSFAVNQRAKELGIRVALGARRFDIVREVFVSGGKPVLQGLVAGVWLSVATAVALREIFITSPIRLDTGNPLLYVGTAALLLAAAALAMLAPARRGSRSDPLDALRCE